MGLSIVCTDSMSVHRSVLAGKLEEYLPRSPFLLLLSNILPAAQKRMVTIAFMAASLQVRMNRTANGECEDAFYEREKTATSNIFL